MMSGLIEGQLVLNRDSGRIHPIGPGVLDEAVSRSRSSQASKSGGSSQVVNHSGHLARTACSAHGLEQVGAGKHRHRPGPTVYKHAR